MKTQTIKNNLIALAVYALALTLTFNAQAESHNSSKTPLDGVWTLAAMYTVSNAGQISPWCEGAFGVIIYTEGYMSTAVNCASDPSKVVLYSGPFRIEDDTVFHHAQNYSDPGLNKVFSRTYHFEDENHLELSGQLGDGKVIVKWVRR